MKAMTIKDLFKACQEEIEAGHGDYTIMLSDDDEGNGYHYCWYAFTPAEELMDTDDIDTDIALTSKTIVLG